MEKYNKLMVMLEDMDSAANIARELGLKELALSLFGLASIVVVGRDNPEKGAKLLVKSAQYFSSLSRDILSEVK